jgi:hypothetical protein
MSFFYFVLYPVASPPPFRVNILVYYDITLYHVTYEIRISTNTKC